MASFVPVVLNLWVMLPLLVNGLLKPLISNQHGHVYEIKVEIVFEQHIPELSWQSYSLLLINKKL
jgi:hypothetical protein